MIEQRNHHIEKNNGGVEQFSFEKWHPSAIDDIDRLEKMCWPPWLQYPRQHLETISERFSNTQLLARNKNNVVVGAITANRIDWDGNPDSLTTWDDVAGGVVGIGDYTATYKPEGNAICVMSASVDPTAQRASIGRRLVEGTIGLAKEAGAEYLIGPFRPSGYGEYKRLHGQIPFSDYCNLKRDNELHDPWLRSVSRLGMIPLRVENESMRVDVSRQQFDEYRRTFQPDKWQHARGNIWECGETGSWIVSNDRATYIEPNLWGRIPLP